MRGGFHDIQSVRERPADIAEPGLVAEHPLPGSPRGETQLRPGQVWSRDELVLALELYFDPASSSDSRDPQVLELAGLIGRTPAAVALKLANFRAIDPDSVALAL